MRVTALATPTSSRIILVLTAVLGLLAFTWPLLLNPGTQADYESRAPFLLAGVLALGVVIQLSDHG